MNKRKIFLAGTILALLTGCGGNSDSGGSAPSDYGYAQESAASDNYYEPEAASEDWETASNPGDGEGSKRIKTGSMDLEAADFDNTVTEIKSRVEAVGGYIENYNMYGAQERGQDWRIAEYTLRIPAADYEEVKDYIAALGEVIRYNDSVEDVTGVYYDTRTRLDMKLAEQSRLLQLLEQAATIEDIILIEERLGVVNGDIEILESSLTDMDRRVAYATLYVSVSETLAPVIQPLGDGLGTRMGRAFSTSVNGIIRFLEYILVFLAGIFVPMVVIGVPAAVGFIIWKRRKQ